MVRKTTNREYILPERGEEEWDELLNENFEDVDADMQTALDASNGGDLQLGENTHIVDENVEDLGAELNTILAESSDGDAILIPPAEYDTYTTVDLDTEVYISSTVSQAGTRRSYPVRIEAQADVGFIDGRAGVPFTLSGIEFDGNGYDNGFGVIARRRTDIRQCGMHDIGAGEDEAGDGILLLSDGDSSNVNCSRLSGVDVTSCERHGVKIAQRESGSSRPNALDIDVRDGRGTGGFIVHLEDGWGNRINIQHPGGMNSEGGFYTDSRQNYVTIEYASSGIDPLVHFDSNAVRNYLVANHVGSFSFDRHVIDENRANTVRVLRDRFERTSGRPWTRKTLSYDELMPRSSNGKYAKGTLLYTNGITNETLDETIELREPMDERGGEFHRVEIEIDDLRTEDSDQVVALQLEGHDGSDYSWLADGPDGFETRSGSAFELFDFRENRPGCAKFVVTSSFDGGVNRYRISREYAAITETDAALVRGSLDETLSSPLRSLRLFQATDDGADEDDENGNDTEIRACQISIWGYIGDEDRQ